MGVLAVRKFFVLDTNVLLHDPESLLSFQDNHVVVPIYVIEEVDHFKRDASELGSNARRVSRLLDAFRRRGNLAEGVPTDAGGTLSVALDGDLELARVSGGGNFVDNALLTMSLDLARKHPGTRVVLVTKDSNLRIKADALSICAEDYETGRVELEAGETAHAEVAAEAEALERLSRGENVEMPLPGLHPNQHVRLLGRDGGKRSVLARVEPGTRWLQPLHPEIQELTNLRPRNMEQHFALDVLLDDSISLVTLMGKAGTGKTLLALAAGLFRTCDKDAYARVLVARPTHPVGRDLGFLPGGLKEKLNPWMQPIYDNLSLLLQPPGAVHAEAMQVVQRLIERGVLEVEPLTFIRGRTMSRQYLVVDEAQNLTPLEIKTIVTRAGEGTKLVFTGDPDQIDNPYIDSSSSGFNSVVRRFLGEPMAAHVLFTKGERSALAERASDLL